MIVLANFPRSSIKVEGDTNAQGTRCTNVRVVNSNTVKTAKLTLRRNGNVIVEVLVGPGETQNFPLPGQGIRVQNLDLDEAGVELSVAVFTPK